MTECNLSPEATASVTAAIVAKYTAKAWHAVPEGTTDRQASSDAHKKLLTFVPDYKDACYVWLDEHPSWTADLPVYKWMENEPHSERGAGHVESIPKGWKDGRAAGAPRVVYIITGSVTHNIATARLWLGKNDISAHWMSGQHHRATGAYVEFVTEHLHVNLGKDEALIRAVDAHSDRVGCCLTYEQAHFVGDFAVGHLFKAGLVTPLWCGDRAEALGATKQPDGTWA
jgi:hypothetical protein